jgi:hypothetical protein
MIMMHCDSCEWWLLYCDGWCGGLNGSQWLLAVLRQTLRVNTKILNGYSMAYNCLRTMVAWRLLRYNATAWSVLLK